MQIKNYAPDSNKIVIVIGDITITIDKDVGSNIYGEDISKTFVEVIDNKDGSEYRLILGKEGSTHKL